MGGVFFVFSQGFGSGSFLLFVFVFGGLGVSSLFFFPQSILGFSREHRKDTAKNLGQPSRSLRRFLRASG